MSVLHNVFGLRVLASRQIPGLTCLPPDPPFDIRVHFDKVPQEFTAAARNALGPPFYASRYSGINGQPNSQVWRICDGNYFRLLYDDGTESFVNREGSRIWMRWADRFSLEEVAPYLLGQALGLAQRLRGTVCLHASAVVLDEGAIVIVGPQGAGKSTTAAAFLRLGYPVLADDVVPVIKKNGVFYARAAHPRIWLCPDIVENFYGSPDALPQLTPAWEKRYADLRESPCQFTRQTVPLAAIYILGADFDHKKPLAEAMAHKAALMNLVANTYMNHLLAPSLRAEEFAFLGDLVRAIPVRQLQQLPIKEGGGWIPGAIVSDVRAHAINHAIQDRAPQTNCSTAGSQAIRLPPNR